MEATLEHPFFVFGQGWSSCQPERTAQRFGLSCHRLSVGDVCISLTHKDVTTRVAEITAAHHNALSSSRSPTPPSAPPNGTDRNYSRSESGGDCVSSSGGDHVGTPSDRTAERTTSDDISQRTGSVHSTVHSTGTGSPSTPHSTPHTDSRHWSITPDRQASTSPDLAADVMSNVTISVDDDGDDDSMNDSDSDSAAARLAAASNVRRTSDAH